MIPYTSCMCFGADSASNRRRPWRLLTAQKGTGLVFDKTDDNALCIRIREGQEDEDAEDQDEVEMGFGLASLLTDSESCLIDAVQNHKPIPVSCDGQVISVSGRRARQPVITPVLDLNLLDDTYSGVTQILLSRCGQWAFNTFNLDVSTGGRSLSFLLVHLFHEYGFVNTFHLDVVKVWRCFNLMEAAYHRHNPYHNSVHAADVTQAMHCFLQEVKFSAHLTPLEAMTSVIAAVAHDLDHPGVTQAFLVATSNHLVNLYNNSSVLENHHWRTAISCLRESGIFDHLEKDIWSDIQGQIRSLILATDITRQKEFLARFKGYLNSETLDMEQTQYRHFALQIALKCADLCNPCRPWSISQRWSYQVCQEFYRQGAYERQLQLPLTPTFDCSRTKVAKIQADFFQYVVSPLFETWDHFLETPLSSQLLRNLRHNYTQWKLKMELMQHLQDSEESSQTETPPKINVDTSGPSSPALPQLSPPTPQKEPNLLSPDANVVIKQHRSKSDSGLTPRLFTPNIHLETYSTEELHPSTTLLSLSSCTNTVQLRKAYVATKVESHLICPTVFQPLMVPASVSPKRQQESQMSDCSSPTLPATDCSALGRAVNSYSGAEDSGDFGVQSPNSDCPDGCCSPVPQPATESSTTCDSPSGCNSSAVETRTPSLSSNYQLRQSDATTLHLSYPGTTATLHIKDCYSSPTRREGGGSHRQHPTSATSSSSSSSVKQAFSSMNYTEEDPLVAKCMTSSDMTPSWCWHISRSLSAERPQRPSHDFDSPLPSWQGSCTSLNSNGQAGRRGSAPVTIGYSVGGGGDGSCSQWSSLGDMVDTKGGLRGGAETGAAARRWSIPTEPIAGLLLAPESTDYVECHDPKETVRRHSFGLLEPFLAMPSSESENDGSSTGPTSTGTTCSTRRNSAVPQPSRGRQCFSSRGMTDIELNDPEDSSTFNSEVFLPCFPPSPQVSSRRRGSLPAEIPIALMCHVASPSRHIPSPTLEESRSSSREGHLHHPSSSGLGSGGHQRSGVLWEHGRRHGTPGDLLSVLIGRAGMLNAMQGMVYGGTATDWPRSGAQDYTRRRSGGLELLSGLWRSRTSEPPLGSGFAGRMKLQRQILDDWVLWGRGDDVQRPSPMSPNRGPGISALSQQFLYQQRRGSVPLDMSLLSLSSGNTYSGDQGD